MKLNIEEVSHGSISIFLWNPDEVFYSSMSKEASENSSYSINVFSPEMFVEVKRRDNNKTIFSSARGPLIASNNYFEWTIYLNSAELMGFDKLNLEEGRWILINNERSSSPLPYVLAFGKFF